MARKHVFRFGIVRTIIKNSGLGQACIAFCIVFLSCSVLVRLFDPSMDHFGDALWYCFQVVTTIGFGDVVADTIAGRIVTVALSVFSIFFIAVITGVVVNYTSEVIKAHRNKSIALFNYKLEHLPELSKDELAELSEKIKKMDAGNPDA